jgi:hypothetical protein
MKYSTSLIKARSFLVSSHFAIYLCYLHFISIYGHLIFFFLVFVNCSITIPILFAILLYTLFTLYEFSLDVK